MNEINPLVWAPGCEGDFYKTAQYRIERFFRSRKSEETRQYAWAILDYLSNKREWDINQQSDEIPELVTEKHIRDKYSWYRSKDLIASLVPEKVPHEITVFRLLEALTEENLIEKRIDHDYIGKGKKPVYYRLNIGILLPHWAMSRERIIEVLDEVQAMYTRLLVRNNIAKGLLKKHYDDPESIIEEKYNKLKNELRENRRKWIIDCQEQGIMRKDIDIEERLDHFTLL